MVFPICCFYVLFIMSTIFSHMSLLLLPQFPCVHYIYPTTLHDLLKAFHVVLMVPIYPFCCSQYLHFFPHTPCPRTLLTNIACGPWKCYIHSILGVSNIGKCSKILKYFVVRLLYKSSKFIHVGIRFFREKFIDDAHY